MHGYVLCSFKNRLVMSTARGRMHGGFCVAFLTSLQNSPPLSSFCVGPVRGKPSAAVNLNPSGIILPGKSAFEIALGKACYKFHKTTGKLVLLPRFYTFSIFYRGFS